jgi:hypothetical protein
MFQPNFLKPTQEDRDSLLAKIISIREKAKSLKAEMAELNIMLADKNIGLSHKNVTQYRRMFDGIGAASWQTGIATFKCKIQARIINYENLLEQI